MTQRPHRSTTALWIELLESLSACGRRFRAVLADVSAAHELNDTQFSLLWLCSQADDEGFSQSSLAAATAVSPAHVSGQLEQLRQRGLLAAQRAAKDRRRQLWRTTDDGTVLLNTLAGQLGTLTDHLEAELGAARRLSHADQIRSLNELFGRDDLCGDSQPAVDTGPARQTKTSTNQRRSAA